MMANYSRHRSHYLPTKATLYAMSDHDRAMMFDARFREVEDEIQAIKDGTIYGRGGRHYLLNLAQARKRRLVKTANDFGLSLDGDKLAA